jgi:PAS domain S-box-containing protein
VESALRILMLEDRPEDAVLVKEELRRGGLQFSFARVETKSAFLDHIKRSAPDVILSDHGLPSFDGFSALRIAKDKCPDTPFVFVTSALGEEFAIRMFENGASDYVLKHHLSDLVPAVKRALERAQNARERRIHEAELQRNEELFRMLVNGVRDYAIYMLDGEGRITTWNSGATRLEGYSQEEALGESLDLVLSPEDIARDKAHQMLETAKRTGRFEEDGWRVRKDGSRYWANVVLTALRDRAGRLVGFVNVAHDITERKRHEEMLRKSEERTRSILETAVDAIVVMDSNGRIHEWNPAAEQIFGFTRNEAVGAELAELIIPFYLRDRHRLGLAQYVADGHGPMLNQTLGRALTICVSLFTLMAGVFVRPELVVEPGWQQMQAAALILIATIGITFSLQATFTDSFLPDRLIRLVLFTLALIVLLYPSEQVAFGFCVPVVLMIGYWLARRRTVLEAEMPDAPAQAALAGAPPVLDSERGRMS